MDTKETKKWISDNKTWLFSGIVVFALGGASNAVKDHWPVLLNNLSLPVWVVVSIALVSIGSVGLFFSRKERKLFQESRDLQARLAMIESDRLKIDERDFLTGLFNLRRLERFLDQELPNLLKEKKEVWGALLDINEFKKKTSGSSILLASDVLEELGRRWSSRDSKDIILRWGGDEFMVLCPNASEKEITGFIRRLQKNASESCFRLTDEKNPVEISLACGMSRWNKDDTKRSFQTRLGRALLNAKTQYASIGEGIREIDKSTISIL